MVKSIAAGSQMKLTGLRLPIGSDPTFDNVVPKGASAPTPLPPGDPLR